MGKPQNTLDYLPISMLAEVYYCERNFYLRFVCGIETTDSQMEKGIAEEKKRGSRARVARPNQVQQRNVYASSESLGLTGVIDALESKDGLTYPVEYKTGELKERLSDQVQLCAEAMVLEEMTGKDIPFGFIHYVSSNSRIKVFFDEALRSKVTEGIERARDLASSDCLPEPVSDERCQGCSLVSVCLPKESGLTKTAGKSVARPTPRIGIENVLYVDEQGAVLKKAGGRIQVWKDGGKISEIPLGRVDQIILVGNVHISTPLVRHLLRQDTEIVYLSSRGNYEGRFEPEISRNSLLRLKQFTLAQDKGFCLSVARKIVEAKIANSKVLLQRAERRTGSQEVGRLVAEIDAVCKSVANCHSLDSLLGLEGIAARHYFKGFGFLLKPGLGFDFEKRNRRPPRDPVNAMLSFGYTLLASDCMSMCMAVGFDPYLGFYHEARYGRPSLSLDIVEEFRAPVVDSVVAGLINKGTITVDDFDQKMGMCFLKEKGREKFFRQYRSFLDSEIVHPRFGYRVSHRRCIEIQFRVLSKYVLGEIDRYVAYRIR